MKKILLLATCLCAAFLLHAQNASEGAVILDKQNQPGFIVSIPAMDVDFVADALKYTFEDKHALRGANHSGFRVYKRQRFVQFGNDGYDIYFKVEQNGPKKNREVKVTLLVSTDELNFISSSTDPATAAKIVSFLNDFVRISLPEYEKAQRISELSAQLKKLQDKKADLEKKQEKLTKDLQNVSEELKQNATDIEKTQQELKALNKQ